MRVAIVAALLFAGGGAAAFAQQYTEVIITGCSSGVYDSAGRCIDDPTPAQRSAQEDRNRREQERLARERAEREAREAEIKRQVDAEVARLGAHRRAEAERSVRMRQEAAAARTPPRQCTTRSGTQQASITHATREGAQAAIARVRATPGGSETITSSNVGPASCTQRTVAHITPPPVGNCFACISEQQAVSLGYVRGKGWPAPEVEWVCTATIQFTAQRCGSGSSTVTAQ